MTYILQSLTTPSASGSRAVAKFSSDTIIKVSNILVAVRNSADVSYDYPFSVASANVGPDGFTFVSDPRSAALPAGTYTAWVAFQEGATWKQAGATSTFTVAGGGTVPGKTVVFSAPFSDTTKWNYGKSSSYPNGGPKNTGDNKLDYISPTVSIPSSAGVFNATRRTDGFWNADLATTEYVSGGFELQAGDSVTADITVGSEQGAWPAIWTWGRDNPPGYSGTQPGHGEVDLFEYHSDNPNTLEFTNHTASGEPYYYYDNATNVAPGKKFGLRVDFTTSNVTWFINGTQVAQVAGVPSYWKAWPIVNLSVCAGQWHPAPQASQSSMQYTVENFKVWR